MEHDEGRDEGRDGVHDGGYDAEYDGAQGSMGMGGLQMQWQMAPKI